MGRFPIIILHKQELKRDNCIVKKLIEKQI